MFTAFLWPHFVCRFIWLGTAWPSLQEWPNRVPRARPSVQGPEGPTPRPAYLPHFVWAAMAAICEAAGKQMLCFHLWNQVSGKISAFRWPELSHWVQAGEGGEEELHSLWTLTCHRQAHRCKDLMLIQQSDDTALCYAATLVLGHSCTDPTKTRTHPQSGCGPVCGWAVPLSVICWCW